MNRVYNVNYKDSGEAVKYTMKYNYHLNLLNEENKKLGSKVDAVCINGKWLNNDEKVKILSKTTTNNTK